MATLSIPFLVDYLYWMRDRVLEAAAALDDAEFLATPRMHDRDLRATLAHELDVEMSWRGKLQGLPVDQWGPAAEIKAEQFASLAELRAAWADHERRTRAWLATLSPSDLETPTSVNGLDGRPLATYLVAMVMHGITELVAAAAILEQLGHPTGDLGLLNFLDAASGAAPGA